MQYSITCVCGEKITINASNDEKAVETMVHTMDNHVAAKEHPQVPKNLTHEQKVGMVRQQMKKE